MTDQRPKNRNKSVDAIQSGAYAFPYHYIPGANQYPRFARIWGFAASYIAAIRLADNWLAAVSEELSDRNHRHMDYGCGDGGFIHALNQAEKFSSISFEGVDIDERALQWAVLFAQSMLNVSYRAVDLFALEQEAYDSGSLVEVLEHIPPEEAPAFVDAIAKSLKPGAQLFVTVPSTEKPLGRKHYRHFNFESLQECFSDHFEIRKCVGFEKTGWLSKFFRILTMRRRFYLEISPYSDYLINSYAREHKTLNGCGRICLIAQKIE